MLLERFYDTDLAQASYVVACQATGEMMVIDPRRDLAPYLELAAQHHLQIVAVTETHIHADYLSGTRELAARTGATPYVSAEGGTDWQYGFEARRLHHGDVITLGNIKVEARHTPGHTPEHLSFLVTDTPFADQPGYYFTGDFVFVGDLGRPDLLDEVAGGVNSRFAGAKQMFHSLRNEFVNLPPYVQVHPAHGAGSACGRALGSIASSTVGYESTFAWWAPYVRDNDEDGFVDALLNGQPDAHAYFGRMKRQNKAGPQVLGELLELQEFASADVAAKIATDEVIFVDSRDAAHVHAGTVTGSLNIPGVGNAAKYGAWVYNPEEESRPLVILADDEETAADFRDHLVRVGIDTTVGYLTSIEGLPTMTPRIVAPDEIDRVDHVMVLDVRNKTEYSEGHVPGAHQLSGGRALWHLDELPTEGTIIAYCQSGTRASVTASALRRAGYDVAELDGSYVGWVASHVDTKAGANQDKVSVRV